MGIEVHNIDQTEAWDPTPGILPPGKHNVVIDSATEGTSSGGYPQLELELRAETGENAGKTIRDWLVVIPQTYGKVRQLLEAADIEVEGGDWELPTTRLPGRKVRITVSTQPKPSGGTADRVMAYEPAAATSSNGDTPEAQTPSGGDALPF